MEGPEVARGHGGGREGGGGAARGHVGTVTRGHGEMREDTMA